MNKQQDVMETMLALLFIVSAIGLVIGAGARDHGYVERIQEQDEVPERERIPGCPFLNNGKQWQRASGLVIARKQQWSRSASAWQRLLASAEASFLAMVGTLSQLLSELQQMTIL